MKENLSLFLEAAKLNIQEAKRIFFGENFKKFYLQEETELRNIYDQLMMGKNRNQILEEFLICTGAKERVSFEIEKEEYQVSRDQEYLQIPIHQKNWGYEEMDVRVYPHLKTEASLITTEQFQDMTYELCVDLRNASEEMTEGIVELDTAFEHFKIIIRFYEAEEEQSQRMWKKVQQIYLDFRCGKCSVEEYCQRTCDCIGEECGILEDLLRLQLAIIGKREEEARNRMEQMNENRPWEEGEMIESYYYYLKALYEKNPLTTKSAVKIIRDNAKRVQEDRAYCLWMLMYLDEEIVFSNKKQLEEIKKLYQEGIIAPILQYETASIWNRNPLFIKEVNGFTVEHMKFGLKYKILTKEVLDQYVRVIRRTDRLAGEAFWILEEIYRNYPEEEYLESICRTILRTGQWKREYHVYLKEAVQRSMKMLGLFEAYIRTLDPEEYEQLDPAVLHYFSYSNSLSTEEKAYLYANIHANRKEYGEILNNYTQKINVFVLKAIEQGLMTNPAVYLYQQYLPDLMGSEAGLIALPNIIFKKKLICHNKKMKTVVIKHMEKSQSDFYELKDGIAYCDIYSDQFMVMFLDEKEDPHIAEVFWEMEALWKEQLYFDKCRTKNTFHEKVLLAEAAQYVKKTQLSDEEAKTAQRLMDLQILSDDAKEMILELLLNYYYENHNYEKLEEYLGQVRWEKLQEKNRASVIEYFISQEMYEEALKGMERYGFDVIRIQLLEKVVRYLLKHLQGRKSMFAAKMCEAVFLQGEAGKEILTYLQLHIPPEADYLDQLWQQGIEQGVYDAGFTDHLLAQFLKEDAKEEYYIEIFLESLRRGNQNGLDLLFERFCQWHYLDGKKLPEEFFDYLTRFLDEKGWDNSLLKPLSWLKYQVEREQLSDREQMLASQIIGWFMERDIYLELFVGFQDRIPIPKILFCISFVSYQGLSGQKVMMHCQEEKEAMIKEEMMTELGDGRYVGWFLSFLDEHPDVYVTIQGDDRKYRKSVKVAYPAEENMGLKYHKINEMLANVHSSQVYDMIEQYGEMEYMMERSLQPWMEE